MSNSPFLFDNTKTTLTGVMKIEKIWGVGQKTAEKMHRMGVFTGLDLRNMSLSRLTQEFGKMGQVFYDFSRGIDNRPVISEWERKSVSCEQTFESDISENAAVTIHLYHTVLELVRRIEKNDFEGRTLTLKVKFLDFQQITRSITVDHILRTKDEILPLAKQLMQQVEFHSHPIRLLGLGVSNQKSATPQEKIIGLSWNWSLSRGQTYNKRRDGNQGNI